MIINKENKSVDIETRELNYLISALVTQYLFYTKNEMPEVITFPMYDSAKTPHGVIPIVWVPPLSDVAVAIVQDGSNVPEVTEEKLQEINESEAPTIEQRVEAMKADIGKDRTTGKEIVGITVDEMSNHITEDAAQEIRETIKALSERLNIITSTPAETPAPAPEAPASPAKAALAGVKRTRKTGKKGKGGKKGKTPANKSDQTTPERIAAAKQPEHVVPPGTPVSDGAPRGGPDQKQAIQDMKDQPDISETGTTEVSDEEVARAMKVMESEPE